MLECLVNALTLPEAYHNSLMNLEVFGRESKCSDWNTKQKEISITIQVAEPLREPMISKCFIGGPRELEQYKLEIVQGIMDWSVVSGLEPYTYHRRMVQNCGIDQIAFVINELTRNPDSRRAVIVVRDIKEDTKSDDPACLQHIQYFIRDGKLHCKALFRSNDACKAAYMNMFGLIMLQYNISKVLGVGMGTYTHRANSYHCYKRDYSLLKGYCDKIERAINPEDVCYRYEGEWKELMEEETQSIMHEMEMLRKK